MDTSTREIVGVYVGDRSSQSALKLWQSLPPVYRQCAVCYTDFWEAYQGVLPSTRHRPVGKESGKTSYIEPPTLPEFNSGRNAGGIPPVQQHFTTTGRTRRHGKLYRFLKK